MTPAGAGTRGIRVVITGKGGVGKTTIAAMLAHHFSRKGKRVLAVDGDPQQNLAAALGLPPEAARKIIPVSQNPEYIRERPAQDRRSPLAACSVSTRT